MLKRTSIVLVALALAGAGCVPPQASNDEKTEFNPETVMGQIQAEGRLTIAVPDDRPPFGPEPGEQKLNGPQGDVSGFDVALGREVADALGVDLVVLTAPEDELLSMVQPALVAPSPGAATPLPDPTKADIAFPLKPIIETAVRQKVYAYSNPYFVGHQRLLVPASSGISDVGDLGGKKICEVLDPETDVDLKELEPDARTLPATAPKGCVGPLLRGKVDAATASDVLLARWALTLPGSKIVGEQITTVGYGAVLQAAASSWKDFVNAQFGEMKTEGRWTAAYEKWLSEALGPAPEPPPHMTTEEAAALFPAED